MNALVFFVTFLAPCFSFYYHNNERPYARYNYYGTENPAIFRHRKVRPIDGKYQYRHLNKLLLETTTRDRYITYQPIDPKLSIENSWFPTLGNSQIGAKKVKDSDYPWIASVFHSPTESSPYICTAACIEKRIFITAARCIAQGQVTYMNVRYQSTTLKPIALVIPSQPTKQMYDDIGFIIVDRAYEGKWLTTTIDPLNRTKEGFVYFVNNNDNHYPFIWADALGHVAEPGGTIALYKLQEGYLGYYFCYELYFNGTHDNGRYFVPCFYTCGLNIHASGADPRSCNRTLAGEGHIITKWNNPEIVGVVTWGSSSLSPTNLPLPVGVAMPSTKNFNEDFQCAKKIRDAPESSTGDYAQICKTRRFNG